VTRVLHVSRNAHPFLGGTEGFVANLIRHTAAFGIDSAILCSDRRLDGEGPEPSAPTTRVPTYGPDRLQLMRRIPPVARALVDWADVLHFHDLRFGLDLVVRDRAIRRKATVCSTHGLVFHTEEHQLAKRVAWPVFFRPVLRRFDAILADSAADYARVRELPGARLVPNPVDVEPFLRLAAGPDVVDGPLLCFGRLAPNKGIDRLVPLVEHGTEQLEIVGTGDQADVRRLRNAFAGRAATFVGSVDGEGLSDALRRCSAVVLPNRAEGFGLTLVEAMATGRAVVAADIPPFREIAGETEVQLVDFDDATAVRAALAAARRTTPRPRSVARAISYSWETRAPEFAALYRTLVVRKQVSTDA
jgi:alpha-1,3-mannosyltransferase